MTQPFRLLLMRKLGAVAPEIPSSASRTDRIDLMKKALGLNPASTTSTVAASSSTAAPTVTPHGSFVGTPFMAIIAAKRRLDKTLTKKQIVEELSALGIDTKSSICKPEAAHKLAICQLTKKQAKEIHTFIDARFDPTQPATAKNQKPMVSDLYVKLFNPVDRMNRLIYELYGKFKLNHFPFRVLLYFVTVGLINLWSWLSEIRASSRKVTNAVSPK